MANIISTVPFNFDELYGDLKTQFEDAGYDTEEGSNTSQLITAMAYFTSMLNINTAVNINEILLPLATKRNNVVQDARALGYEIQHKLSYSYKLDITLLSGKSYSIPKYTEFTSGDYTYYYMGTPLEFNNLTEDTNITIKVTEGILYKSTENQSSLEIITGTIVNDTGETVPQYFIDVPFTSVEENGLEVFVTYYDELGTLITKEEWEKSPQFVIDTDLTLDKKFIRLDNIEFKTPRIYFQLANVGKGIRVGSIVNINALTTSGILGKIQDITIPSVITHNIKDTTGVFDVAVTKITLSSEGADEETIASIKENAPKFFNSANRAVTKSDYESICNRQSAINSTIVWGGDEEFPKSPGHVWFSFKSSRYQPTHTPLNSFNTNYILDYGNYTNWDYTYTSSDTEYDTQVSVAETYYSNLYLENEEIRSGELNDAGDIINLGVWDELDNFKIPSIEFHNRHPIFVDFEYNVNILKYQIINSKASINSDIYNVINDYFIGSATDTFKFGEYETEYFHSSLEKRIDSYLTDTSGYNNTVTTKILLTEKNISDENTLSLHRDIYIPLSLPFENYFDTNGDFISSVLPVINTDNFLDYSPIGSSGTDLGQNLVVRWDEVSPAVPTPNNKIITAPIRITQNMTKTLSASQTLDLTTVSIDSDDNYIEIYPDIPAELESGGTPLYNEVTVILNATELTIVSGSPSAGQVQINDPSNITFGDTISGGGSLSITINRHAGTYYLINTRRKFISVHLFVDATGVTSSDSFSTPKDYLTTAVSSYTSTISDLYLTTEGYVVITDDEISSFTGSIVKKISTFDYTGSPIKYDLFKRDRYINLDYNSPNFKMNKNLLPRLKTVSFT